MSGICGIINFNGAPVDRKALSRMAEAASHRGPDGIRYRTDGNVGFAHLALHITPESLRERQPLAGRQGGIILTADARLDNREELISSLTAEGYLEEDQPTDADLIMAAYRCWGSNCAEHLLGDFAFAVWDASAGRLFAARDAMAMRAFYYRVEPRRLLFATEVKQILAAPDVPVRIFEPAVGAHLAGRFALPAWTFYEGIDQLPPAHALLVDASGPHTWRYWDIDPDLQIRYAGDEQYAGHFLEIFKEAVRCRLRSVKPVGISLSGGVDSGSVASTAGWLFKQGKSVYRSPFHAYCWAFEELSQCDERHLSGRIIDRYGFPVTNIAADEAWPLKDYPAHGPDRDEPYIFYFQVLIERLLEAARSEGMGLMLTGERGDFMVNHWVYDYLGLLRTGQWRLLREEMQEHSRLSGIPIRRMAKKYLIKPLLSSLRVQGRAEWLRRPRLRRQRSGPAYPDYIRPEFARRVGLTEIMQQRFPQSGIRNQARRQRCQLIFSSMSMRRVMLLERSQAGFGLGFADPWSDRRLAGFVIAVPQMILHRIREYKRLARMAMQGIMPEAICRANSKINPTPLYERGVRDRAKDTAMALLTGTGAGARGYIDEKVLRKHYESFLAGQPERYDFWWALTLEMWLRRYWS